MSVPILRQILIKMLCLFVSFDSLHTSQQLFSHVRTGLPGLNQYKEEECLGNCLICTVKMNVYKLYRWFNNLDLNCTHYTIYTAVDGNRAGAAYCFGMWDKAGLI